MRTERELPVQINPETMTCKIEMPDGIIMIELTKEGFELMMNTGEYLFDKEKNILHYVGKIRE